MRVWVSVGEERHADGGMGAHSDLSDLEAHELPAYGGKKVEDVDADVESQRAGLHVISVPV